MEHASHLVRWFAAKKISWFSKAMLDYHRVMGLYDFDMYIYIYDIPTIQKKYCTTFRHLKITGENIIYTIVEIQPVSFFFSFFLFGGYDMHFGYCHIDRSFEAIGGMPHLKVMLKHYTSFISIISDNLCYYYHNCWYIYI